MTNQITNKRPIPKEDFLEIRNTRNSLMKKIVHTNKRLAAEKDVKARTSLQREKNRLSSTVNIYNVLLAQLKGITLPLKQRDRREIAKLYYNATPAEHNAFNHAQKFNPSVEYICRPLFSPSAGPSKAKFKITYDNPPRYIPAPFQVDVAEVYQKLASKYEHLKPEVLLVRSVTPIKTYSPTEAYLESPPTYTIKFTPPNSTTPLFTEPHSNLSEAVAEMEQILAFQSQ